VPFHTALTVQPHGDDRWRLVAPLVYLGERDRFEVPAGYVTDYATVPRVVSWLIPRYGRWTRAAIVHDYLITDVLAAGEISPVDVDGIFRRILRELGVSTPRRWLMWAGVRWGSLFSGRAAGWLPTAPAVLAVSLAALVPVAVGALGVLVGSVPLALAELVSPPRPEPTVDTIAAGTVTAGTIAARAVTAASIRAGAITTGRITAEPGDDQPHRA
jgi:hypothetical protein